MDPGCAGAGGGCRNDANPNKLKPMIATVAHQSIFKIYLKLLLSWKIKNSPLTPASNPSQLVYHYLSWKLSMRHVLVALALCAAASYASAECPTRQTISAWGHTYNSGGLLGALSDATRDCDSHDQPSWLAKINDAPASNGIPLGLVYCRQVAHSKDPQNEAQRRDCIFWYGHSIEAP